LKCEKCQWEVVPGLPRAAHTCWNFFTYMTNAVQAVSYQYGFTGWQTTGQSTNTNGFYDLIDQGSAQTYGTGRMASILGPTKK
jgi:hypothetical protein